MAKEINPLKNGNIRRNSISIIVLGLVASITRINGMIHGDEVIPENDDLWSRSEEVVSIQSKDVQLFIWHTNESVLLKFLFSFKSISFSNFFSIELMKMLS